MVHDGSTNGHAGQYRDEQAYMKDGKRRRFQLQYPRGQVLVKTDVSKYELTFECKPYLVSLGAQKAFLSFADEISSRWEKDAKKLGEGYFKDVISKAILFRWTDRMVGSSEWYRRERGYKAQIVTYTVAWVVSKVRNELNAEIDLRQIWSRQSVPEPLATALSEAAPHVATAIKETPESVRNVSEYAKRQACWASVRDRVGLALQTSLRSCVIDKSSVDHVRKEDRAVKRIDDDIDLEMLLVELMPYIREIREAADRNNLLSPMNDRAMGKLAAGRTQLTKSEKKAMRWMFGRLDEVGVELPSFLRPLFADGG